MGENITVTWPEHMAGMRGEIVNRPTNETANVRLADGRETVMHTDNFTVDKSDLAFARGRDHGVAVGSWVFNGNTSEDYARRILTGYEDGDPEVMDIEPSPLSGEWADGPTPRDVYAYLGMSETFETDDPAGQLLTDYELGFSEGYWTEVTRSARAMLGIG